MLRRALCHHVHGALEASPCVGQKFDLFSLSRIIFPTNYPVVPKGDEEIRFQISADHTPADIDAALDTLAGFAG